MKKLLLAVLSAITLTAHSAESSQLVRVAAPGEFGGWSSVRMMPTYCKKHGLNVELTMVDLKLTPQLAIAQGRGDFDVVGAFMAQTLKTVAQGNKVHVFSNLSSGGIAMVTKVDSNINKISDLKGKRVIVAKGTAVEINTKIHLAAAGLSYSFTPGEADVTLVHALSIQSEAMFMQGAADAAVLTFPESTKLLDSNVAKIIQYYPENNRTLVARNDFSADKEQKLANCMQEIYQVLNNANRTPEQQADIVRSRVIMPDPSRKEQYQWHQLIDTQYLNNFIAALKKDNELPADFQLPADFNRTLKFKK